VNQHPGHKILKEKHSSVHLVLAWALKWPAQAGRILLLLEIPEPVRIFFKIRVYPLFSPSQISEKNFTKKIQVQTSNHQITCNREK
jgi:hypothetical protein